MVCKASTRFLSATVVWLVMPGRYGRRSSQVPCDKACLRDAIDIRGRITYIADCADCTCEPRDAFGVLRQQVRMHETQVGPIIQKTRFSALSL